MSTQHTSTPTTAAGSHPLSDWLTSHRTFIVTYVHQDHEGIRLSVTVGSTDDITAVGDARVALVDALGWEESAEWAYLHTDEATP